MKTKIFGEHDEATIAQIERCVAAGGERGVLCADGHKGYAQPIGGVVAYTDKISLSGVGFDIACGNLAIRTDANRGQIAPVMEEIMNDVMRDISFGIGQSSKTRIDHELFDDPAWQLSPMRELKQSAASQLDTMGSNTGSCAKAPRPPFPDRRVSLVEAWATTRSSSRGLIRRHRTKHCFRRSTARAESCRGLR